MHLVALLLQLLGSLILSGITIYTLWAYRRIKPRLIELRSYAYKRPLIFPKDYDELIVKLAVVLDAIIGGDRIGQLLLLALIGFALLACGMALELLQGLEGVFPSNVRGNPFSAMYHDLNT